MFQEALQRLSENFRGVQRDPRGALRGSQGLSGGHRMFVVVSGFKRRSKGIHGVLGGSRSDSGDLKGV